VPRGWVLYVRRPTWVFRAARITRALARTRVCTRVCAHALGCGSVSCVLPPRGTCAGDWRTTASGSAAAECGGPCLRARAAPFRCNASSGAATKRVAVLHRVALALCCNAVVAVRCIAGERVGYFLRARAQPLGARARDGLRPPALSSSICTPTHVHARTPTPTRTHTRTYARPPAQSTPPVPRARTHVLALTHLHTHARTHARTHSSTRTHARTRTGTHTHALSIRLGNHARLVRRSGARATAGFRSTG
jgi:hypothetical protein